MKRLINHQKIYSDTEIDTRQFSAIDIISLLSALPQLQEFDISTDITDTGDICFIIGNDTYTLKCMNAHNING